MNRMHRRPHGARSVVRIVGAALLIAGFAGALAGCGRGETADAASEAPNAAVDESAPASGSRVVLSREQIEAAGIELAVAGPATILSKLPFGGRIVENGDTLAHVAPRFPGLVRSVEKRLGDRVAKGDLLAVVESNQSLHPYEIRAGLAGVVLARDVAPGEYVAPERPIFTIGDLSTVWIELDVYRRDFGRLARGQRVFVDGEDGRAPAQSTLAYLAPFGSENTQTLVARAALANGDGRWKPGQFVSAEVLIETREAPIAVPVAAIQRIGDGEVVFVARPADGTDRRVFEARPVTTGSDDGEHVAIESGIAAGESIAVEGSFILKAEAGKSGVPHSVD